MICMTLMDVASATRDPANVGEAYDLVWVGVCDLMWVRCIEVQSFVIQPVRAIY